ncbi:MAG: rod shape-determining protein MreC [Thermomicrobiales bacterium]
MTTFSARQTIMLVVLFVVTSLAFIALDNRTALDPVQTGLREVTDPIADAFGGLIENEDQSELAAELARVTAERDALLAENVNLRIDNRETEQLREQVRVQEAHPEWTFVTARVINTDPTNLQKFIIIDKGSADGIEKGMAVVDPNFYVGQVTAVEEHSATVTLVIDASATVGAQFVDSGAIGVVFGTWQSGGRAEMRHVARGTQPNEDELVITAINPDVQTNQIPGNLVIGKVESNPQENNQGDTLTFQVLPVVEFEKLKVVSVIVADESSDS